MNQKQRTHIEARIRSAKDYAIRKLPKTPDNYSSDKELLAFDPPEKVKAAIAQRAAADSIIRAWRKSLYSKKETEVRKIEKEAESVSEILLFGDEEKALNSLKAFEAKYGPKD